jgi:formylglycine-generating enzyme required for sulfatase activity
MMEYFEAQGQNAPYPECMRRVAECDVLAVIVAHRYGWMPPDQPGDDRKSITRLECEQARADGKEILFFEVDDDHPWLAELREGHRLIKAMENGQYTQELAADVNLRITQLRQFKSWLGTLGFSAKFKSPDGLRAEVESALHGWLKRNPGFDIAAPVLRYDPQKYFKWMREQTAWIDIRGLQVGTGRAYRFPIEDLYIPMKSVQPGGRGEMSQPEMLRLDDDAQRSGIVVVGDPGSGKTTFLRRIASELCFATDRNEPTAIGLKLPKNGFPILIRIAELEEHIENCVLRSVKDAPTTRESPAWLPHFLERRSVELGWDLSAAVFEQKLHEKSTVVLLDGLDEAPSRVRRESVARLFESANRAYAESNFVVTTRPQAYIGESILKDFHEIRIDDLSSDAVERFLHHWACCLYPDDLGEAEKYFRALMDAFLARPEIRRMAKNPVMLTALAVVHWNERRLPEQRADLYDSVVTWLARSREQKPGRESADRCLTLLGRLALGMQDQNEGRVTEISKGRAAEIIGPILRGVPEPDRLDRALAFLDQEEVDSGIVISRGHSVRFWHLTFQEFLAARTIAGLSEAAQQNLLMTGDKVYLPEWREVVLLLGGILLVKQGPEKIDGLVQVLLDRVGPYAPLAAKARCAALIGSILRDLRALAYEPADRRYREILDAALGIFTAQNSSHIDLIIKLETAEALGQAGDPRLGENNWVSVPAGKFLMGSQRNDPSAPNYDPDTSIRESPVHPVQLDAFQISRYLVTVEEYRQFLEDDGYSRDDWWQGGPRPGRNQPGQWEDQLLHPNRPAVGVTWYEARAYCRWRGGHLPTEAQWERAARGLEGRRYAWGNQAPTQEMANYGEARIGSPSPVGLFPQGATPEDVHDLAGNVFEWTSDWYSDNYYARSMVLNPRGPSEGSYRTIRSCCYRDERSSLPAAIRSGTVPQFGSAEIGFRCCRSQQ